MPAVQCEHSPNRFSTTYTSFLFNIIENEGIRITFDAKLSDNPWKTMYDSVAYTAFYCIIGIAYLSIAALTPYVLLTNKTITRIQIVLLVANSIPCLAIGLILLIGGWRSRPNLPPDLQIYATLVFVFEYFSGL